MTSRGLHSSCGIVSDFSLYLPNPEFPVLVRVRRVRRAVKLFSQLSGLDGLKTIVLKS